MKRVSFNSLQSSPEEARIRQRHQRLLQDYLELQKEFVSKKKKLQTAKDKRETLLAEVRFLRRRHGYLQKMQYFKTETENFQYQNSNVQPEISAEERNYSNLNEAVKSSHTRVSEIKSILGSMEEKETNKEAIRLQKKPKNCLINGKRVGKKKISVQDQVVLEV
ncbi:uncharacterized protein LOC21396377 [Morus notabilis]|uniref:uncharacterized protein LOC21396377 n=1 Tax=Morus notabilis TaxID=981085 RepID=UPI000CED1D2E|nr:uncharacterized protein LOC21396377 [Morus notabilis]